MGTADRTSERARCSSVDAVTRLRALRLPWPPNAGRIVPGSLGSVGPALSAVVAAISGIAAHALHHVGPLAGTGSAGPSSKPQMRRD